MSRLLPGGRPRPPARKAREKDPLFASQKSSALTTTVPNLPKKVNDIVGAAGETVPKVVDKVGNAASMMRTPVDNEPDELFGHLQRREDEGGGSGRGRDAHLSEEEKQPDRPPNASEVAAPKAQSSTLQLLGNNDPEQSLLGPRSQIGNNRDSAGGGKLDGLFGAPSHRDPRFLIPRPKNSRFKPDPLFGHLYGQSEGDRKRPPRGKLLDESEGIDQ